MDDSKDSSVSEGSDEEEQYLIHHPEEKVSEIDFEMSKKVLINKKMYNNFLGPVVGEDNLIELQEDLREIVP